MDGYGGYSYDRNGDYISETNEKKTYYKTSKAILFLSGFFLFTEFLISIAAVAPPMLKILPSYILIVSIGLCVLAAAGYIAATIFGCRRVLRRVKIEDFPKIAYTSYSVVILASILPRLTSTIIRIPALDEITKNIIVWLFAPMRLLRMFGLNNLYSIAISHIVILSAITVTYLFAKRKEEEKKGNIKTRKTRIIKKKQPNANKIKRRKTKVKETKLTKRRTKKIDIFSLLKSNPKKSVRKHHRLNLSGSRCKARKAKFRGANKKNIGSMMRKIENFSKNKYR